MTNNAEQVETTFDSWAQLASRLAKPALGCWQELGRSSFSTPSSHGIQADRLEAFARSLMLGAMAGAGGDTVVRAQAQQELAHGIESGLLSGPTFAWPRPSENSQAIPEAASIAIAMWIDGHALWSKLDDRKSAAVIDWFRDCAHASESRLNNWRLFGVVIAKFLASVGASSMALRRTADTGLQAIDHWYDDRGWYSDGLGSTYDYYNSFAFHFYPPLLAFLSDDEEMRRRYAPRLERYISDLSWLIDDDGAPVYFGRSLTYRFAIAAPFSVAPLVGIDTVSTGNLEIATRCANYFLKRGAVGPDGIVHRGWHGADDTTAQNYSGELASYWFAKSFVHLLAPKESEYWKNPTPSTVHNGTRLIEAPGFLVSRQGKNRPLKIINHGSYDRTSTDLRLTADDPQYSRFEYSSVTAPSKTSSHLSNTITLKRANSSTYFCRSKPVTRVQGSEWLSAEWEMRPERKSYDPNARHTALIRKVSRRVRRASLVASAIRARHPKVSVSSGFLGGWAVHAIVLSGRVPPRSVLNFTGWGVNKREASSFDNDSDAASSQPPGYLSELVPITGWEHASTTDVMRRTAMAESPAAPQVTSPAVSGALYIVATSLADGPQLAPQYFEVANHGTHIKIWQGNNSEPLVLPHPLSANGDLHDQS